MFSNPWSVVWVRLTLFKLFSILCFQIKSWELGLGRPRVKLTRCLTFLQFVFPNQIKSRPWSGWDWLYYSVSLLCVFRSNQDRGLGLCLTFLHCVFSNQIKSNQDRGLGRPRVRLTRGRPTFPNWCFNWLAVELQQDDAFDNGGFDNALNYRIITIMGSFWNVIWPEKVLVLEGENHVPSHNVQGACLLFSWHLIILIIILLLIIMAWSCMVIMMMAVMFSIEFVVFTGGMLLTI